MWKDIPRFFGNYRVNELGDVKSVFKVIERTDGRVYTREEKILSPSLNESGYYQGAISDSKKLTSYLNHRMVAEAFIPNPENKPEVNHKNGIKTDNRIENLEWVTHSENIKHAFDMGLMRPKVGSLNGMSKLNEDQVREIRQHAKENGRYYGRPQLAKKYNVSECTIKEVVTRRKNKFYNADTQ